MLQYIEFATLYISHLVKELRNNSKSSPAQDSDEVELQVNPSYVTVGAAHIQ